MAAPEASGPARRSETRCATADSRLSRERTVSLSSTPSAGSVVRAVSASARRRRKTGSGDRAEFARAIGAPFGSDIAHSHVAATRYGVLPCRCGCFVTARAVPFMGEALGPRRQKLEHGLLVNPVAHGPVVVAPGDVDDVGLPEEASERMRVARHVVARSGADQRRRLDPRQILRSEGGPQAARAGRERLQITARRTRRSLGKSSDCDRRCPGCPRPPSPRPCRAEAPTGRAGWSRLRP